MLDDNNNLLQIYPNPTSSEFTLESAMEIFGNLKIVDALGREIRSFDKQYYSSTTKKYSFDASQFLNGTYYCVAQYGKEKIVRKFLVAH